MMQCWQNTAGFTLIEMMITVAIIAIVTAIAYPSMQKQIAQQRLKEAVNITETTLKQARADALILQSDITITMTTNSLQTSQNQNIAQTQTFNPKITVTKSANSMPMKIIFTKTKRALDGIDVSNPPMQSRNNTDSIIGYCFGYTGVSVDKYILTVDALANINVVKDTAGVC